MKKGKFRNKFNLKYLEKLVKDENSGIHLKQIQDHLAIHPYHLHDLNAAVRELLDRKIGKYCPRIDGILCGYKDIKFLSETGCMCDDSCFIHINIQADYFVFEPTEEKLLLGVVTKKTSDHVGCLVHNLFNVSLPKPKRLEEDWIGESLTVSSEIYLKITHTNFEGKLPYIRGEIVSVLTKAPPKDKSKNSKTKSKKKSAKKKIDDSLNETTPTLNEDPDINQNTLAEENSSETTHKRKKRKKKLDNSIQISEDMSVIENEEMEPPRKKKKKSVIS